MAQSLLSQSVSQSVSQISFKNALSRGAGKEFGLPFLFKALMVFNKTIRAF